MAETRLDALVVGAGFAEIYACYRLRGLGLNFHCVDNAGDVGGTWYHNTYPGAMSDTHSHLYRYSWDEEDAKSYPWTHNYLYQADILAYLRHVVEKHDLRNCMQFHTEMVAAIYNEQTNTWKVTLSTGQTLVVRYLITAMGLLSQPIFPDVPGIRDFKGTMVHSFAWKKDSDLKGKRVALLGNGSTGFQITTAIAPEVKTLTCFVRHPQYVVPAGRREVTPKERNDLNDKFGAIWEQARGSATAFGFEESKKSLASASPAERERVFEHLWESGNGFYFMMGGFSDISTNEGSNEAAASFIRRKIKETVRDPETARILSPTDYYARRPLCGTDYYEQFNRENVNVIDLNNTPMASITSRGIITVDGVEHEFDVIIFATGFDALDTNYTRLHMVGRGGQTISEHWSTTITSFFGISLSNFPNMFMILGPQSPLCNNPPAIEAQVDFIAGLIERAEALRREKGLAGTVEVTHEAELRWAQECEDGAEGSLFKKTSSWIFGCNVPGKIYALRFYFPGLARYRDRVSDLITRDYDGIVFR